MEEILNSESGDTRTACLRIHEEFEQMEIEESTRVAGTPIEIERDESSLLSRSERQGVIIMLKRPVQELIGYPEVTEQVSNEASLKEVSKVARQVLNAVNGGRIKVGNQNAKFSFKAFVLTPAELEYWTARSEYEKLEHILIDRVEGACHEWTPLLNMTEEALARISDEGVRARIRVEAMARRREWQDMQDVCRGLFQRRAEQFNTDQGVIHAPGLVNDPGVAVGRNRTVVFSDADMNTIRVSQLSKYKVGELKNFLLSIQQAQVELRVS